MPCIFTQAVRKRLSRTVGDLDRGGIKSINPCKRLERSQTFLKRSKNDGDDLERNRRQREKRGIQISRNVGGGDCLRSALAGRKGGSGKR